MAAIEAVVAEASAPASSANLGPGFDVIALALGLRCRVMAEPADEWSIDHGEGQQPDSDSDDAVLAAARRALGEDHPVAMKVDNEIPIGRGLGSSAAAIAAGSAAALLAMGEGADPDHVFELTASMEGHPDNAAAAVYGGLVLVPAEGRPRRLPIHPGLQPVVAVPAEVFFTAEARRAVPGSVKRDVAIRTGSRIAALVAGLITGDAQLLAAAHGDEIHEGPRSQVHPETARLVQRARSAGALHAAWSGSGPSVIAIVESGEESRVTDALTVPGIRVFTPEVATEGLVLSA
ncbi:MAG: homoserine kinase [Acidimicrobiia bacterium]